MEHLIVFMMLLVRAEGGLKKERRGARGQLFSFPFDLVGMGMNTTSLMNLQIQIEKTSEGGLVEVGVKIEQFCFGSCPFFEAGCSRNCSGNLCHGCARKGILTACIIEQKYVFSLFRCTTVPRFIQECFCKFQANPQAILLQVFHNSYYFENVLTIKFRLQR